MSSTEIAKRQVLTHLIYYSTGNNPASILSKSIAGRYRPVSYPDGPITARYRFIKNAYWKKVTLFHCLLVWQKNPTVSEQNSVDPDKTPQFAVSDLGLHYLLRTVRIGRINTAHVATMQV